MPQVIDAASRSASYRGLVFRVGGEKELLVHTVLCMCLVSEISWKSRILPNPLCNTVVV